MIMFFDPLQNTLENKTDSMAEILKKPHEISFNSFTLTANYRNSSSISYLLSNLIKKYFFAAQMKNINPNRIKG